MGVSLCLMPWELLKGVSTQQLLRMVDSLNKYYVKSQQSWPEISFLFLFFLDQEILNVDK